MKKILVVCLLWSYSLFALDLDPKILEDIIAHNPNNAYKEKLLLAKYYVEHNNKTKAMQLVKEVLAKKPHDKSALKIANSIQQRERAEAIYKEASLSEPIQVKEAQKRLDTYYSSNNYQFYSKLYEALVHNNVQLDDLYHIKAAYIYLWDSRYALSKKALARIEQKNNIDAAKIRADICYYQGKYNCAVKLYEKLYRASYDKEYGIKLLYSYLYLGKMTQARTLYSYLVRKYPHNKKIEAVGEKLQKSQKNYINKLQKAYESNANYKTLEAYANGLNALHKENEAIALVDRFNKQHATKQSLILEAKYLLWNNETPKALDILHKKSLANSLEARLMEGKIFSWNQKFPEALKNLNYVIIKTKDPDLLYDAKKAKAFVYMWQKENTQAKALFENLALYNPQDQEIKEALLELNHHYKTLINIYQKRSQKGHNIQNIKYLSDLYLKTNRKKEAITLLKEYVAKNPQDLDAQKQLGLLLIEKKDYYAGFGYLEYYAAQKQSLQSALLLAKNYYWNGFSKEALDVLDRAISHYPDSKELVDLKAKILKVSPRYTTSNSGATIASYFDDIASKQLKLADSLYFNGHYKSALEYYRSYLQKYPNSADVRYRYAFALENAQEYAEAEGEFSLLFWTKDSDELRYHYAYNMMKNNKLQKAQKLLEELKKSSFHPIDPDLKAFLNSWKEAWQSQDFKKYEAFYSAAYQKNALWAFHKQESFKNAKYIAVSIYDPLSKSLGNNNYLVRFFQAYATDKHQDKGYKTLQIHCDKSKKECQITKESWQAGKYKKAMLLTPYIENALKEIKRLKAQPLSLNIRKKKTLLV